MEPLPDTWESGSAWPSLAWLSISGPIICGQLWRPRSCPGACHLGGHWKYAHLWESTPEAEQGTGVRKTTRLGTSNPKRIFIFFRDKGYKGLIIFIIKKNDSSISGLHSWTRPGFRGSSIWCLLSRTWLNTLAVSLCTNINHGGVPGLCTQEAHGSWGCATPQGSP